MIRALLRCDHNVLFILQIFVLLIRMVDVVSARVDDETRRRMKRCSYINWSEVIREAIIGKLREEERRRDIDIKKLLEAARITDSIREPSPGWDSTEEIRRWRERRR